MRNILYAIVLVITGVFIATAYQWARENYVPSPSAAAGLQTSRVRFPEYDHLHRNALRYFSEIPASERDRLRANLQTSVVSVEDWLARLDRSPPEVICLGEKHDDITRDFLARRFFSRYAADVVMLEMRRREFEIVDWLIKAGIPRLSLLDADIAGVLRSVRRANPDVKIHPIEETRRQMTARLELRRGSRENSILENFSSRFERGRRNVVLYGALHCADSHGWLMNRIRAAYGDSVDALSVNVIYAHGSGGIEAFVNFAEDIGITPPPFAIPRTALLDPELYAWFPALAHLLKNYDAAIVYDPRAADRMGPQ